MENEIRGSLTSENFRDGRWRFLNSHAPTNEGGNRFLKIGREFTAITEEKPHQLFIVGNKEEP
jgi:hypothetical protein